MPIIEGAMDLLAEIFASVIGGDVKTRNRVIAAIVIVLLIVLSWLFNDVC